MQVKLVSNSDQPQDLSIRVTPFGHHATVAPQTVRANNAEPTTVEFGELTPENIPNELKDRVDLHTLPFEEFAKSSKSSIFDSAIFSWSF
jgi:hypothetical protein